MQRATPRHNRHHRYHDGRELRPRDDRLGTDIMQERREQFGSDWISRRGTASPMAIPSSCSASTPVSCHDRMTTATDGVNSKLIALHTVGISPNRQVAAGLHRGGQQQVECLGLVVSYVVSFSLTLSFAGGEALRTLSNQSRKVWALSCFMDSTVSMYLNDMDAAVAHDVALALLVPAVAHEHQGGGHGHHTEHDDTGHADSGDRGAGLGGAVRRVLGRHLGGRARFDRGRGGALLLGRLLHDALLGVGLARRLHPRQSRVHVLLAVQTRDDLLGLLATVLHEQPRGTLHAQRRRQHQEQQRQDDREGRQVAPARARVGEEEGDGREQDADGHRDLQTQTQDVTHVRRCQLVRVGSECARGSARRDAGDETAGREGPDVRHGRLDDGAHDHEDAVDEQQLLAAPLVAEVAAAQRADHAAEDPCVDGERPLELRVAREHEARVLGHGTRVALVRVVVLRQVGLRGRPAALEGLQQRHQDARVHDHVGLDLAGGGLLRLVEVRHVVGSPGRRGLGVHRCWVGWSRVEALACGVELDLSKWKLSSWSPGEVEVDGVCSAAHTTAATELVNLIPSCIYASSRGLGGWDSLYLLPLQSRQLSEDGVVWRFASGHETGGRPSPPAEAMNDLPAASTLA
ncbi:hypothetical protein ON010_g4303 [Phytophthora cinnamomi]|nr:hypothetical protein ON010_g4303 [Phytophthora cinnamomi]